jgi:DNA polymerase
MLRPALLASDGNWLAVADWSSIEARVNPWLSGRGDAKLELFRSGRDVYKVNAMATFRVAFDDVTPDQRQVGKVQELACLSEDTLVLTACGEKRIQNVLPGDLVWDGVNWVRTDGPIYKGEKHVIEYDGLCATPDHLVWVEGQTNPIGFERAAAHGLRLARPRTPYEIAVPSIGETVDGGKTALRKPEQPRFQNIWGARHYVQFWFRYVGIRLGLRKHRSAAGKNGIGSRGQHKALSGGKLALVHQSAKQAAHLAYSQHGGVSSISASTPRNSLRGQHIEKSAVVRADVPADYRPVGTSELQTKRRVWDLLNCGPLHRFTAQGRLVHNCGFAGGVGAFAAMGRVYGLALPEPEAKRMVDGWRKANTWALPFWQDLEQAYTRAMRHKGHEFTAGRITYLFDGVHLWYALPSGRVLCYPFARLETEGVTYAKASWKPAADAKEWPRARLWKGLACENVTQATANDLLRYSLRMLDAEGFEPVLHVHDEIVLETDDPDRTVEALKRIMCSTPTWAEGIPLGIEAHTMRRYGK